MKKIALPRRPLLKRPRAHPGLPPVSLIKYFLKLVNSNFKNPSRTNNQTQTLLIDIKIQLSNHSIKSIFSNLISNPNHNLNKSQISTRGLKITSRSTTAQRTSHGQNIQFQTKQFQHPSFRISNFYTLFSKIHNSLNSQRIYTFLVILETS